MPPKAETSIFPLEICVAFLNNVCNLDDQTCPHKHAKHPFLWQFEIKGKWYDLSELDSNGLEEGFRIVHKDGVHLTPSTAVPPLNNSDPRLSWYASFDRMSLERGNTSFNVRRLSTPSSALFNDKTSTDFAWYVKEELDRWILYGTSNRNRRPQYATTFTSDDIEHIFVQNKIKKLNVGSNMYQYVIDFERMTQVNTTTKVVRPIRRRLKMNSNDRTIELKLGFKLRTTTSPANRYKMDYTSQKDSETQSTPTTQEDSETQSTPTSQEDSGTLPTPTSQEDSETLSTPTSQEDSETQSTPTSVSLLGNHCSSSFSDSVYTNEISETNTSVQLPISSSRPENEIFAPPQNVFEEPKSESNPDESFPSENYEWFFNENGSWVKYGQPSSEHKGFVTSISSGDIEKKFKEDPFKCIIIESRKNKYLLDFVKMTQTNLKTRSEREICRKLRVRPTALESVAVKCTMNVTYEWYFNEQNCWIRYGDARLNDEANSDVSTASSNDIEQHYSSLPLKFLEVASGNQTFILNFMKMTETNTRTHEERPICRRAKILSMFAGSTNPQATSDSESFPLYWSPMTTSETSCITVPLSSADPEYRQHVSAIKLTLPNILVSAMCRLQNPYLWKAYVNRREYVKQLQPEIEYKEQYLFHGTNHSNISAICEESIDWRLYGLRHGHKQGRGSYFSSRADLACRYSHGPSKVIFITKVLVGNICKGSSGTVRPSKDSSGRPFDTTVDRVKRPQVMVKYDNTEFYPEYYVEFTKKSEGSLTRKAAKRSDALLSSTLDNQRTVSTDKLSVDNTSLAVLLESSQSGLEAAMVSPIPSITCEVFNQSATNTSQFEDETQSLLNVALDESTASKSSIEALFRLQSKDSPLALPKPSSSSSKNSEPTDASRNPLRMCRLQTELVQTPKNVTSNAPKAKVSFHKLSTQFRPEIGHQTSLKILPCSSPASKTGSLSPQTLKRSYVQIRRQTPLKTTPGSSPASRTNKLSHQQSTTVGLQNSLKISPGSSTLSKTSIVSRTSTTYSPKVSPNVASLSSTVSKVSDVTYNPTVRRMPKVERVPLSSTRSSFFSSKNLKFFGRETLIPPGHNKFRSQCYKSSHVKASLKRDQKSSTCIQRRSRKLKVSLNSSMNSKELCDAPTSSYSNFTNRIISGSNNVKKFFKGTKNKTLVHSAPSISKGIIAAQKNTPIHSAPSTSTGVIAAQTNTPVHSAPSTSKGVIAAQTNTAIHSAPSTSKGVVAAQTNTAIHCAPSTSKGVIAAQTNTLVHSAPSTSKGVIAAQTNTLVHSAPSTSKGVIAAQTNTLIHSASSTSKGVIAAQTNTLVHSAPSTSKGVIAAQTNTAIHSAPSTCKENITGVHANTEISELNRVNTKTLKCYSNIRAKKTLNPDLRLSGIENSTAPVSMKITIASNKSKLANVQTAYTMSTNHALGFSMPCSDNYKQDESRVMPSNLDFDETKTQLEIAVSVGTGSKQMTDINENNIAILCTSPPVPSSGSSNNAGSSKSSVTSHRLLLPSSVGNDNARGSGSSVTSNELLIPTGGRTIFQSNKAQLFIYDINSCADGAEGSFLAFHKLIFHPNSNSDNAAGCRDIYLNSSTNTAGTEENQGQNMAVSAVRKSIASSSTVVKAHQMISTYHHTQRFSSEELIPTNLFDSSEYLNELKSSVQDAAAHTNQDRKRKSPGVPVSCSPKDCKLSKIE